MSPQISAVVPTLGRSPWLVPCLEALRRDGGEDLEILLVAQGEEPDRDQLGETALAIPDRVLSLPANVGFARANNLALAQARGEFLATVNDDVVVVPGWCEALLSALAERSDVAAVQGVNLRLDDRRRIDGCGVAWNRSWQAVQIGHGEPLEAAGAEPVEIFGVSATAAVYRRAALLVVDGPRLQVFEERLFAYYEDVELAVRLRAAGYRALLVPSARAHHAGSVTGRQMRLAGRPLVYGNRLLVLARLLGRAFWPRLPRILLRDLADFRTALWHGELLSAWGIVAGGWRAVRRCPGFVRRGRPAVPLSELRRFQLPR